MTDIPEDLKYTTQHEWLKLEDGKAVVGVTAFAADALGDVVFVDLPPLGAPLICGDQCGEVESTKSISDLYAPASGEVIAVNEAVIANPALINTDSFGEGWLFEMRVEQMPDLLDAEAYVSLLAAGGTSG